MWIIIITSWKNILVGYISLLKKLWYKLHKSKRKHSLPGVWFPEFIVIPPWPLMPWRPKALSPVRNHKTLREKMYNQKYQGGSAL